MNLARLLERSAQLHPDVPAVRDARGTTSFARLHAASLAAADALRQEGLRPGDRVAVLAQNRVEYVVVAFACFRMGLVLLPLNWRLRTREITFLLRDAEASVVLAEPAFFALVPDGPWERLAFEGATDGWRGFAPRPQAEGSVPMRDDSGVAVQMYTSGTTGDPKGSMLGHDNVSALLYAWLLDMRIDVGERFLQVTPLFHVGGLLMMVSTVAVGATLRLLPEFEARTALTVMREERITHALFVPAMVQWLLQEHDVSADDQTPDEKAFEALQLIVYGAAPMPVPVLERALAVFGCDFLQGYGLTETAGVLTTLRPPEHRFEGDAPQHLGSIGRPILCADLRLVDASGEDVGIGEVGEIVARGPNIHRGYWKRPASDREAVRDGWFHTGDLARIDAGGFLYIVDRSKDMICVAGENVYPREVETVLLQHEGVGDAAVIGIPHAHWGEEVLALVVPAAGGSEGPSPGDRELIQHCRSGLARFKCPTRVEWRTELPRNAAGKLEKKRLREPYWVGMERKV